MVAVSLHLSANELSLIACNSNKYFDPDDCADNAGREEGNERQCSIVYWRVPAKASHAFCFQLFF